MECGNEGDTTSETALSEEDSMASRIPTGVSGIGGSGGCPARGDLETVMLEVIGR